MTSRDWQADRRAVFDRDDHACRHCGTVGSADDPTSLRTYPVGDVPLEGTVHESTLATVCTACFETLQGVPADTAPSRRELFELVRETTRTQGEAIADVASFASLATSLPATFSEAEPAADSDDDTANGFDDDTAPEYRRTRREVLLGIDVVDAHLERLAAVDDEALEADVRSSLATVVEAATALQSTLHEVVGLAETVVTGLERCPGCFDALSADTCPTCGLAGRETSEWRRDDGDLAFERLFSAINDELQAASETTEQLTGRATTLAGRLSND